MLAPNPPHPTESKFRLLYMGTNVELIMALRKKLREPDYRLVACSDNDSAMMFLSSDISYDLLLIDLEWQGGKGLKLARLVRSLEHRKEMPILLAAESEVDEQLAQLARQSGVTQFVTKTPAAISEAIRQSIGKSRQ
jgi:CheY-like chemotaxis protein